jgi:surface polysaccharide O-acyltransferase-like enzyme
MFFKVYNKVVSMSKNRIFYYDLLRAFAIIAVIMCHVDPFFGVWQEPGIKFILHSIFHGIGLIGVPIFLMLSGALLLNRDYDLSYFIKRRFSRIFPPAIFWMAVILLCGFFYFRWDNGYLWNIFIGNGSIMWYFWILIGIYLAIPIINSFIKEYELKGVEYFLVIWFAIIILKTFQLWPLFPPFEMNTNFELNIFVGFMGYLLLGYYLVNKDFRLNNWLMAAIGTVILILSLGAYVYMDTNGINMGPLYQNVTNVLMAVGMLLMVKYIDRVGLFENIESRPIGKAIISISVCSYGMYFAHFLIVNYLSQFDIHSNKFVIVMLLIVIVSSWVVTYVLSKIPYLKTFSGA